MRKHPIRLGIIGLGRAGLAMHCQEIHDKESKYTIVAACDTIAERRAQMAQKYGCRTYARIADLLADPEVEVADIATRSCDHYLHAVMALKAGKTVFLEKPMCQTYAEACKLRDIVRACGGRLYVRHNRRFEPGFQHVREIIASGILGKVFEIKLRRVSYQCRSDWQAIRRFGGGQLLNWGPHLIDHGLRLLESPLKHVWSDLKKVTAVGDAEDHLKLILTGANGRIIDIEISGGAALGEPEYLVWGTRGSLACTGMTITLKYINPKRPFIIPRRADPGTPGAGFSHPVTMHWVEKSIPVKPKLAVNMTTIWDVLYRTIRQGAKFPIAMDEAVGVMQVVSLARK